MSCWGASASGAEAEFASVCGSWLARIGVSANESSRAKKTIGIRVRFIGHLHDEVAGPNFGSPPTSDIMVRANFSAREA